MFRRPNTRSFCSVREFANRIGSKFWIRSNCHVCRGHRSWWSVGILVSFTSRQKFKFSLAFPGLFWSSFNRTVWPIMRCFWVKPFLKCLPWVELLKRPPAKWDFWADAKLKSLCSNRNIRKHRFKFEEFLVFSSVIKLVISCRRRHLDKLFPSKSILWHNDYFHSFSSQMSFQDTAEDLYQKSLASRMFTAAYQQQDQTQSQ